jgi:hypothetical protein
MKKVSMLLLAIILPINLAYSKGDFSNKYTRTVLKIERSKVLTNGNLLFNQVPQLQKMINSFNQNELNLFTNHSIYVNNKNNQYAYIPIYKRYTHGKHMCGDMRNWHVATLKGYKYGVDPAFLVAIRSQENPKNDGYAYGVKYLKGTDLWRQGDAGAKCVKHWANYLHFNPMKPTKNNMYELAKIYVGTGDADAKHWSNNVWCIYLRLKGEID